MLLGLHAKSKLITYLKRAEEAGVVSLKREDSGIEVCLVSSAVEDASTTGAYTRKAAESTSEADLDHLPQAVEEVVEEARAAPAVAESAVADASTTGAHKRKAAESLSETDLDPVPAAVEEAVEDTRAVPSLAETMEETPVEAVEETHAAPAFAEAMEETPVDAMEETSAERAERAERKRAKKAAKLQRLAETAHEQTTSVAWSTDAKTEDMCVGDDGVSCWPNISSQPGVHGRVDHHIGVRATHGVSADSRCLAFYELQIVNMSDPRGWIRVGFATCVFIVNQSFMWSCLFFLFYFIGY